MRKDGGSAVRNLPSARRFIMSCFCNLFNNDTIIWVIVIILLLVILGN